MIERISTHILNTALGVPALGVPALLETLETGGRWLKVGAGTTDADGRIGKLNGLSVLPGDFRITFDTADYFRTSIGTVFLSGDRAAVPARRGAVALPHPGAGQHVLLRDVPRQLTGRRAERNISLASPERSPIVTVPSQPPRSIDSAPAACVPMRGP